MSESIVRLGIVKGVEAQKYHGEFKNVAVKVEMESRQPKAEYSSDPSETKKDIFVLSLPLDTTVNPGDLVQMDVVFTNPIRQRDRFAPALEASSEENNTDE